MNKFCLWAFCLLPTFIFSQQSQIQGIVAVFNSKFETGKTEYLANVQVEEAYQRSQATASLNDGSFTVILVGLKSKEPCQLSVKKQGWEIVNNDKLNVVVGQSALVRLVMSPKGKIDENKRKYYNIGKTESEKSLAKKIKQKQDDRTALLQNAARNQKEMGTLESEIKILYEQYQHIDDNARQLAERFSRVNLDDASEYYQRAFRYFQNGKIDSALIVLDEADFEQQVADILLEQSKLTGLDSTIRFNDSVITQRKDALIKAAFLKIDAHLQLQQYQDGLNMVALILSSDDLVNWIKKRPDFRNQVLADLENLEKAGISIEKINALRSILNL